MNVLITGAAGFNEADIIKLSSLGLTVTLHPDEQAPVERPEIYEAVVCNALFMTSPIERFTALRIIQLTSAGLERVPMEYINAHGIVLHSAAGVYGIPMAEHAVCGVLELYRQSANFRNSQAVHEWVKRRNLTELFNKTVCIVGTGNVGTECAKRFSAFGCHILGVNRTPRDNAAFDEMYAPDALPQVLPESDIVILSLALTPETRALVRACVPRCMQRGAILVNLARGGLVDTSAVADALASDLLGGAVLDVFEPEPLPPESPLWDMPNVILTPHNAYAGDGNKGRLWEMVRKNLVGREE